MDWTLGSTVTKQSSVIHMYHDYIHSHRVSFTEYCNLQNCHCGPLYGAVHSRTSSYHHNITVSEWEVDGYIPLQCIFYLIDLGQSVNKSREPHTPHYDINGILCGDTCISSNFQCVHWWVVEKCSTFNGSACGCMLISWINNVNYRISQEPRTVFFSNRFCGLFRPYQDCGLIKIFTELSLRAGCISYLRSTVVSEKLHLKTLLKSLLQMQDVQGIQTQQSEKRGKWLLLCKQFHMFTWTRRYSVREPNQPYLVLRILQKGPNWP